MDPFIARLPAERDGDLMLCRQHGIAYQADMQQGRVAYDDAYWDKVMAYEGSEIARAVIEGRVQMLRRHASPGEDVFDIGAGTGAFVRAALLAGFNARGSDVMPSAIERLRAEGIYGDMPSIADVVTMWDSVEHMERPDDQLDEIARGTVLLASVPIFRDLDSIRASKHYRPGEHLLHFTTQGFIDWLGMHGFRFSEFSLHEIDAGREDIGAFAFIRERMP